MILSRRATKCIREMIKSVNETETSSSSIHHADIMDTISGAVTCNDALAACMQQICG
eukprot:m.3619 g.3619  ORF g.3619 m.3619 type:complete len:57 (-) comp2932_c0_seq1:16-186(-)